MVCENYENCGNMLYKFESYIDTNDGKFVSRKYYCPSCYKGQVVKADVLSNQGIMKLSI